MCKRFYCQPTLYGVAIAAKRNGKLFGRTIGGACNPGCYDRCETATGKITALPNFNHCINNIVMSDTEMFIKHLPNDIGGKVCDDKISITERPLYPWEKRCHALLDVLDYHKISNYDLR